MTLTPEQQERIRINRARALAIQKERREKEQKEKKKRILESTTKNDKEEGKESVGCLIRKKSVILRLYCSLD